MKEVTIACFIISFIQVIGLVVFNRYRVSRIIERIKKVQIDDHTFSQLLNDYEGFLGHLLPFPPRRDFAELYCDVRFSNFALISTRILRYLFISTPLIMTVAGILIKMH